MKPILNILYNTVDSQSITLVIWMDIYPAVQPLFSIFRLRMEYLLVHKTWRQIHSTNRQEDSPERHNRPTMLIRVIKVFTSCFSYNFITSVSIRRLPGLGEDIARSFQPPKVRALTKLYKVNIDSYKIVNGPCAQTLRPNLDKRHEQNRDGKSEYCL